MSSSVDAGHSAEQLRRKSQEKCPRSPNGEHKPVVDYGLPPSAHYVCEYCKADLGYSK